MQSGNDLVAFDGDSQVCRLEALHILQRKVVSNAPSPVPDKGVNLGQRQISTDDLVDEVV